MLCRLNGKVEIRPKFGPYLQDLRLILKKRLLYLIGFAANTGNSSISHTLNNNKKKTKWVFLPTGWIVQKRGGSKSAIVNFNWKTG